MSIPFSDYPSDPGPTREELFARLRDSDEASLARDEILAIYYPFMYAVVRRYPLSWHDKEVVVSNVMLSLTKALPSFRYNKRAGRFRNYVKRCLHHAWLKLIDETAKRPSLGHDPNFLDAVASEDSLLWHVYEDEMRGSEVKYALDRALAAANPKHAAIARDVFSNKLSASEIATKHATTADNVYQVTSRTREAVRKVLRNLEAWPGGPSESTED